MTIQSPNPRVMITLTPEVKEKLELIAKNGGASLASVIRIAIGEYLTKGEMNAEESC